MVKKDITIKISKDTYIILSKIKEKTGVPIKRIVDDCVYFRKEDKGRGNEKSTI